MNHRDESITSENTIKFIDFFAGIGGFRKGMELAGHKCVGFCEFDKFAVASYTSMHLLTEEQREYLNTLPIKKRQKEILKEEYRNGEWYASDIREVHSEQLPESDCWCFGAPCQDFSVAGKRAGMDGDRSSLIREIFRLLEEQKEEDRPEWLIYENVKGMLSSNKGLDYLSIISEMDRLGYDIEWQNINSRWWVPQNRERIYTIGHLRRFGRTKILPVTGTDGENNLCLIGCIEGRNSQRDRIYGEHGNSPTISTCPGGNTEPKIGLPCFVDMTIGNGITLTENAGTLQARYNKGMTNHSGETSGIAVPINVKCINIKDEDGKERPQQNRIYDVSGDMTALSANLGGRHNIAIPVLTPDRAEKRQNGRRFKENGDPMFTLTAQDKHGVAIDPIGGCYKGVSPSFNRGIYDGECRTIKADSSNCIALGILRNVRTEYGKEIRKEYESGNINISRHDFLASEIKEDNCTNTISTVQKDNLFAIGIIDQQGRLNKKVSLKNEVPTLRSETHGNLPQVCVDVSGNTEKRNEGIYVEMPEGFIVYAVWYEKEQCYITIRKLTPKECFRLQGWTDDYFEKAAFVNSDSQLYKQAGNGVTVSVVEAIANKM